MQRSNIEKIAQTNNDRILLAKLWDKINIAMQRNIPSHTAFLSPRELEMCKFLFGQQDGLFTFGGYPEAERQILCFLPDYLEQDYLSAGELPVVCLRATFYDGDTPSHRDFLGALMGCGITRETVGDICVGKGYCIFFVTDEIAPYLLQNFTDVGLTKIRLQKIPLAEADIPQSEYQTIKDTLSSVRLDSVISAGFRISRSLASQAIIAGKAAIDGVPCEKPDKPIKEGSKISLRGNGKIKLDKIGGQTKKGRISVEIHRYL